MIRLLLFTALSIVVSHLESFAQSVDLEAISIGLENTHLKKSEITDIIVTIKQNGPQDLPPGSARIIVAINSDVLNWVTPLLVSDNLGNLWTLHTSADSKSSQIQLRNDNAGLLNDQLVELRIPVLCISEGTASLLIRSAVFGISLSDPDGSNQSKTSSPNIVSADSKYARLSETLVSSKNTLEDLNQAIYFYPNPVTNQLKIKGTVSGKMRIYNNAGREVYNFTYRPSEGIDMRHLSAGLYMITITHTDGSVTTKKVIKQ